MDVRFSVPMSTVFLSVVPARSTCGVTTITGAALTSGISNPMLSKGCAFLSFIPVLNVDMSLSTKSALITLHIYYAIFMAISLATTSLFKESATSVLSHVPADIC